MSSGSFKNILVGWMNQNMNFKEKWVYEEKVSSYKKWLQIIYNSYMSAGFGIELLELKQPFNWNTNNL